MARLVYGICCSVFFCVFTVLAVLYGRWFYNWYDSGVYAGSSGMIHFALWLVVVELIRDIVSMVMGIFGIKKTWVHWTKWE